SASTASCRRGRRANGSPSSAAASSCARHAPWRKWRSRTTSERWRRPCVKRDTQGLVGNVLERKIPAQAARGAIMRHLTKLLLVPVAAGVLGAGVVGAADDENDVEIAAACAVLG